MPTRRQPRGPRGETMPVKALDSPPDSESRQGLCPRCEIHADFEVLEGPVPVSFDYEDYIHRLAGQSEPNVLDRVVVLRCSSCRQAIVVVEEQRLGPRPSRDVPTDELQKRRNSSDGISPIRYRGVHWWPHPGAAQLDSAIPEPLREAFSEGMRCLGVEAPRAAAVMFRRTVEGIVRDTNSKKGVAQLDSNDLAGALKILAKEGVIDSTLGEWADDVRLLGNTGGHFDPICDVSLEQANDLAQLVRQILRYQYEERARRDRIRAASARQAIQAD